MMRQCGDCQLCCKLLPVPEIGKLANTKCKHQRHHVGCTVYHNLPISCATWNCRWLVNDDTGDLSRPDRSHYVIDIMPDHVTAEMGGVSGNIQVVQIWVDPKHPNAHRDPALRRYLERRASENTIGIVRYNASEAIVLLPPAMTGEPGWTEVTPKPRAEGYSLLATAKALQNPITITPPELPNVTTAANEIPYTPRSARR